MMLATASRSVSVNPDDYAGSARPHNLALLIASLPNVQMPYSNGRCTSSSSLIAKTSGIRTKIVTLTCCCLIATLFPRYLSAAKWSVDPYVSAGGIHNDNIRLTTGPHDSVSRVNLTSGINSRRETATSFVSVDALANGVRAPPTTATRIDRSCVMEALSLSVVTVL